MKFKQKKSSKTTLSEKIADALTVKPRADIEDDQVFGTKPHTVSRADFSSSDSEDDAAISDFRKRNVNLLSDISKKYQGQVVSQKETEEDSSDGFEESDSENDISAQNISLEDQDDSSEASEGSVPEKKSQPQTKSKHKLASDSEELSSGEESEDYSITKIQKQINGESSEDEEADDDEGDDDEEGEGYDISEMPEPLKENFEHVKKQNVSEEAKKGACVRNQLLIWEGLLEMRIHLQRCVNTANQMPLPDTFGDLKQNNEFVDDCNTTKANITTVLDK